MVLGYMLGRERGEMEDKVS